MARIKLRAILNMKVSATPTALELIEDLKKTHGKDLLFHQSGGCCDGSAPMCYPAKEYMVGDQDVLIGEIGGKSFDDFVKQYKQYKFYQKMCAFMEGSPKDFGWRSPGTK